MLRKARKKGVTPLQIMQFVGPQGLMRRVDVAELARRWGQNDACEPSDPPRDERRTPHVSR